MDAEYCYNLIGGYPMKFYFWTNSADEIGDYDLFCICDEKEKDIIVKHFKSSSAESVSFLDEKKYIYLINTNKKLIAPLTKLSYAFGGQYNAFAPIGNECENFHFELNEYNLILSNEENGLNDCRIKLNELLKLTNEEIKRTKIRFNQSNGKENPIDIFKLNPEQLLKWNYWNSQSYKEGQISIGLVKMNFDEWLLFTVGTITKVKKKKFNSGVACEYKTETKRFGKFFGRVIVKYRKPFQSQFPNAATILDDLEVKQVLPSIFSGFDFPGYDNVSLSFSELEMIINGNFPSYRNALENQQAVYVLTDTNTGNLYVGSATSKSQMLLSRWTGYIKTFHNENKGLKELYASEGEEYFKRYFKFSIIENFNSKVNADFVISRESYWKKVLDTKKHGYNKN